MKDADKPNMQHPREGVALEPRVAKLETGLDRLTEDVKDLAGIVRSQGQNVEQEIQKLVVAVTQASGPRKTDWTNIIAGLMLIMAIGTAVFWPLNQQTANNKEDIGKVSQTLSDHMKMDNHPVGAALQIRLEEQEKQNMAITKQLLDANEKANDLVNERLRIRIQSLEDHNAKIADENRQELNQWRQKAMGLNTKE